MKKIILSFSLGMMILTTVLIVMSVDAKDIRQDEINGSLPEALEAAVESAMSETYEDRAYTAENSDEFVTDFLEKLCIQIDSAEDIEVKVLDMDKEHGLMSVEVNASFPNAGGNVSRLSCVKTAVFEKEQDTAAQEYAKNTFMTNDGEYKVYSLPKGSRLIIPKSPEDTGFRYWSDVNGHQIDESYIVNEDMTIIAVYL